MTWEMFWNWFPQSSDWKRRLKSKTAEEGVTVLLESTSRHSSVTECSHVDSVHRAIKQLVVLSCVHKEHSREVYNACLKLSVSDLKSSRSPLKDSNVTEKFEVFFHTYAPFASVKTPSSITGHYWISFYGTPLCCSRPCPQQFSLKYQQVDMK